MTAPDRLAWAGVALLLPAAVLTALSVLTPGWRVAVLATSFAPYALAPYAVALVLLGVAWARGRRTRVALALVVTVALAAVPSVGLVETWTTDRDREPRGPGLATMTVNLRFGLGDPDRVLELVRAHDVGLLAVQEVTPEAARALSDGGLDRLLPYVAGEAAPGAIGTMLFSRHPLGEVERLPTGLGSWAATVTTPGGSFTAVAVHAGRPDHDLATWRREHAAIRAAAEDRAATGRDAGRPVLLLGDFNATPDHDVMRAYAASGWRRAVDLAGGGPRPTWPADGQVGPGPLGVPSLISIDHVLVGPGLTATRAETATVAGSDHRALVVTVHRTVRPGAGRT